MRFLPSRGVGLAVLFSVSAAMAEPTAARNPDTCQDAFSCGALSAHLAGADYPGAFRAIRRGCEIETRTPIEGGALFACEHYAELLISAGTARGGDPAKGVAMLEQMCKARPVASSGSVSPCSTLARECENPPKQRPCGPLFRRACQLSRKKVRRARERHATTNCG